MSSEAETLRRYFQNPGLSAVFLGTGSYPLVPQGWQREIRLIPSQIPFKTPHSLMASMAYCEQEGVWRQWVPSRGDMVS